MELKDLLKESYYYTPKGMLFHGDSIEWMSKLPDKSIDMVCADLPYNVTQNKWDLLIDVDELWTQYKRTVKDNGAIVLFGQDKFTAMMMLKEPKLHRYNLIWDKVLVTGFLNANRMPLRSHEDIMIFYKKLPTYNPQKTLGKKNHSTGKDAKKNTTTNYGDHERVDNADELGDMKHPKSILTFEKPHASVALHPTEKPVSLYEWLIKSYSNEGEIILDNTSGSGTCAEASENTNRKWICIEKEKEYCDVTVERLKRVHKEVI